MEPGTPLNRESIVEAALAVTRSDGLDAVTMRALGNRLGVTAMALYRHVEGREELIRLTVDRIGSLTRLNLPTDASWQDRVRSWAFKQREVFRLHPGVAGWLMDNGPAGPQAYRVLDLLASALTDAGLDDARAARASALIMSWTFSRAAIEDNARARRRTQQPERTQAFLKGLETVSPDAYPSAARIGPELFTLTMREIFETGLDWIIAGIEKPDSTDPGQDE